MTVFDTATASGTDLADKAGEQATARGFSRRNVLLGAGAAVGAFGLMPAWSRPPELASGTVFHDRSGAGERRASDPGIAGVLVSNGRDIVRTDEDGRWQLALHDGDSVFVIKPAHWSTPLSRGGVPNFSYLHQPLGTPQELKLHHAGVLPTGALPRNIDFPLRYTPEPDRFEAMMIADPQPQDDRELSFLRADLAATAIGSGAAFALVHGDVAFDDLSLYPRYLDLIGSTGMPWHHCPGNHDMNAEAQDTRFAFETWKRTFGPCHYAFQYAHATFIVLSNVSRTAGAGRNYGAEISPDQLHFVRNLLAHTPRDHLVVLSMHIPLMASHDIADPVPDVVGRRELLQLLSRHPHTVSFSGHTHTSEHHYLGSEHGFAGPEPHHHNVLTTLCGSWWGGPADHRGVPLADCQDGSPRGFHLLQVDGNRYRTRFVGSGLGQSDCSLRTSIDVAGQRVSGVLTRHDVPAASLVANLFGGGPRSQLTFEIAGHPGGPRPMLRQSAPDPAFIALHAGHAGSFKPWVQPVASTHVWRAPMPADLGAGAHRVTVRAIDEYGDQHVSHAIVEIAAETTGPALAGVTLM